MINQNRWRTTFVTMAPIALLLNSFFTDLAMGQTLFLSGTDVFRSSLDGTSSQVVTTGFPHRSYADVAVSPASGTVFWIVWDTISGTFVLSSQDGGRSPVIVGTGFRSLYCIEVDDVEQAVFYGHWGTNEIRRANFDGGNDAAVISLGSEFPLSIALAHPEGENSRIYWSQWNGDTEEGQIWRAELILGNIAFNHEPLVTGLSYPEDIAIAEDGTKLYWVDRQLGVVQKANSDGTAVQVVAADSLAAPSSLVSDEAGGVIIWIDYVTGQVERYSTDDSSLDALFVLRGMTKLAFDPNRSVGVESRSWHDVKGQYR